MRLHDLSPFVVRYADDGALDHVSVRKERRFDLGPGDIVAGGNDHVVGARDEVENAALVPDEIITRDIQAVADVARLALVSKLTAACGSPHGQESNSPFRHCPH